MEGRAKHVLRALVVGLVLALAVPGLALAQQAGSQSGTTGNGNGSQSGSVSNNQTNSQTANGSGNQQNQTNQNCVAGRDCVNNNITNQNQAGARFEAVRPAVRAARVRRVRLAFTGFDLRTLFLVGSLVTGGGVAVLMGARRRWSTTL